MGVDTSLSKHSAGTSNDQKVDNMHNFDTTRIPALKSREWMIVQIYTSVYQAFSLYCKKYFVVAVCFS